MSRFVDVQCEMTNQALLLQAFEASKYEVVQYDVNGKAQKRATTGRKVVEVHPKPVLLNGYYAGDKRFAEMVIRKNHLGSSVSTDMGFGMKDGKIEAYVDHGYGDSQKMLADLQMVYAKLDVEQQVEAAGYSIDQIETLPDGTIVIEVDTGFE